MPKNGGGDKEKVSWIDKENFLPLKDEYTDKRGKLHRVFTADEVETINGIPTVMKRTMKNLQNNHRTEVTFESIEYNLELPDDLFTERSLQNVPQKWIR
jgi:outer membrane lipoprotein-sorting protein